jgi:hypothetical protein
MPPNAFTFCDMRPPAVLQYSSGRGRMAPLRAVSQKKKKPGLAGLVLRNVVVQSP